MSDEKTMLMTVGVHINNGPTFNELSAGDVRTTPHHIDAASGQMVHEVQGGDMLGLVTDALVETYLRTVSEPCSDDMFDRVMGELSRSSTKRFNNDGSVKE